MKHYRDKNILTNPLMVAKKVGGLPLYSASAFAICRGKKQNNNKSEKVLKKVNKKKRQSISLVNKRKTHFSEIYILTTVQHPD